MSSEPIRNGIGEAATYDNPAWPRYIRITDIAGPRSLRSDTFRSMPPLLAAQAPVGDGDLLLAAVGATYGTSYLHGRAPESACYAGYLVRFRSGRNVNPRFAPYWTESRRYWAQVHGRVIKSTIQNFSASRYGDLDFLLPPIAMQGGIADFLDRETGRIDALIDKKRRLIDLLEEKRTATITHAVTKGIDPTAPMKPSNIPWIGAIPDHWDIQRLAMVMRQMTNGFVGPTRDILVDQGVRYIQSLHVKEGLINFHTPYFVSPEWSQHHSRTILGVGDILLVQTGDIGQSAVVGSDIAGSNCHALIIMRTRDSLADPKYFGYAFRSDSIRDAILETRTGALHPHLNVGSVRDVKVPVPPPEEQGGIAEYLSDHGRAAASAIAALTTQLALLTEYREALITAAVTGEIDVDTFDTSRTMEETRT